MSIEVVEIESSGLSGISVVEVNQGPTGPAGPASEAEVKSSSFTAEVDGLYHVVASATATDPSTPEEGKGFSVFVRNGTATVGGVAYATAGTIIERIYHSGSYTNYVYKIDSTYATASQGVLADAAAPRTQLAGIPKTSNFTAVNGEVYVTTGTAFTIDITDPAATTGHGYTVHVRRGSIQVDGATTYTAGTTIKRYVNGVGAWATYEMAQTTSTVAAATAANGLKTASTTVAISSATAPSSGQVLTATSDSAATWQTPSGGDFLPLAGGTLTGEVISTKNGAASTPAVNVTGVPFAGTGTTSFPLVYINDANATASTTLNTAGTYLGVNGDGTQDLMKLMKDGSAVFTVDSSGSATSAGNIIIGGSGPFITSSTMYLDQSMIFAWGTSNRLVSQTGIAKAAAKVLDFNTGSSGVGGTWRSVPTSPTQITANQNDYNPSGSSYYLRLSTDASRTVTGLTFTAAQVDGQSHVIVNVGANDLVLANESASSTAVNRFKTTTGADITLTANQQATIFYDATTARWRVSKNN